MLPQNQVLVSTGTYKDLADFGFAYEGGSGLFGHEVTFPTAPRPQRLDTSLLSSTPTGKPREVVIRGAVLASSLSGLESNIRALIGWCARAVAVKTGHDTTKSLGVRYTRATWDPVNAELKPSGDLAAKVTVTFQATDPLWYSTSATSNALTTSLTEQALGTAPVRPVITFTGAPSGLTVTYANSGGTTVQTLTLAALTTSGATATAIDMANLTVVQTISGVATNAIDKLTTGDFFALDPADADTVTPTWCKVLYALSGGSVSAVTCVYRKCYY